MKTTKVTIPVSDSTGTVHGEVMASEGMKALYVFAHGAGAGMNHPFMVGLSTALAGLGIGTMRYNFPYMEKGSKRPDVPAIAEKTVKRAIETAGSLFPGVPLVAGGKSFGGRMTSQASSRGGSTGLLGLVFVGFPLHAAGKPSILRADHLKDVVVPMLFLQGTRDALADITLMEQVCSGLPGATLSKFEGADHSFRAGKQDLLPVLARTVHSWLEKLLKKAGK